MHDAGRKDDVSQVACDLYTFTTDYCTEEEEGKVACSEEVPGLRVRGRERRKSPQSQRWNETNLPTCSHSDRGCKIRTAQSAASVLLCKHLLRPCHSQTGALLSPSHSRAEACVHMNV